MSNASDDGPTPPQPRPTERQDVLPDRSTAAPAAETFRFEDIFPLDDIQRIQDAFAEAADVASLITDPDGRPITRPSNFTPLCRDIIRATPKGLANCLRSDARLGRTTSGAPTIARCLSAGLLDGATCVFFGGRHIATWLVGQVVDESTDLEAVLAYGREIGADATAFRQALMRVPRMPRERFAKICQALRHFANHLSSMALRAHRQSELIGELRRAKDRVKERDRRLADIIDFLPDPTMVVDAGGTVVFWNRAMEKLTGVGAVDMLGKGDFEYGKPFYGYPTPLLVDYARGAVTRPDPRYAVAELAEDAIIAEVTVAALPAGPRHVWAKAVALRDEAGRIVGGIEAIRDVTDRHEAEKALAEHRQRLEVEVEERTRDLRLQAMELAEANIRLSELDRMKSVFLSTVSHELRTPLTSILGFAKLIGRDFNEQFLPLTGGNPALAAKGKRIADNLAVVFGEAERLTRLINDVLDLSRIESGSMHWRDTRFAPAEVLARAAKTIEGLLGQRPEVSFRFTADAAIPDLRMDPDQLIQVVSNLLQNAVKFTRAGEVRLELTHDGGMVRIAVTDTGIGIPAEELDSIFDKFHQVGRGDTIQETAKGTGLGLAICRQIVRHYGGRIWAESTPGKGSAFFVQLPAVPPGDADGS
ncbi:MAG: PocR ligand-binding domain-containing protein [Solidesulfovibrio sp.]|uniref:sensor histidine kinase n=1 Tax=Solidesulfovibrio sp. TaxID=2910990 RepID=UPI002B2098F2|nr:PocR ligand-binding domain-containing protein [Solidesulfovibrio sp.]MEA4854839.1 PocR ligand-binding domain-containing protein [Solidesulfovibrio sp.]